MTTRPQGPCLAFLCALATAAVASTPIQSSPAGDAVWVTNPDSDTVARLDPMTLTRTGEFAVGDYPRTLVVTADAVFVTNQQSDSVSKLDATSGAARGSASLPFGCAPYGIAASSAGDEVYVSCQGTSQVIVLGADLTVRRTIALEWPEPRAIAVSAAGKVYVTHFITKEPNNDGHVSEVDIASGTVARVFAIPPDHTTCETLGSGQGVANLLSAIAIAPPGAPAAIANQLWVGGTVHNVLKKGLFQRSRYFRDRSGIALFPQFDYASIPAGEGANARRNLYSPAAHDVARAAIWKIDLGSGTMRGKLDIGNGGMIAGLAFASDGQTAVAVDQLANGFYIFNTARGTGDNPASLFEPVPNHGPGGIAATQPCSADRDDTSPEDAYLLPPQARLVPTQGMNPLAVGTLTPVNTGVEYTIGVGGMRGVPDGIGTTPHGVALSPSGDVAYVANYLARTVTVVNATNGGFVCHNAPTTACTTRAGCPSGGECMPLVQGVIATTATDPVPAEILDGKILFSTAARDATGHNGPTPPWNVLPHDASLHQGQATNTARDGGSLACATCHPDFGGQDGRTWDFSQLGASMRNTMDLRGRAGFSPGMCTTIATQSCTTDAECRLAAGPSARCLAKPGTIPSNIRASARADYFNPMGSIHWNGDRDEVEDFEFAFREVLGASDCDGNEHAPDTCVGALALRRFVADPVEMSADLFPEPNRHRSLRLDHLGDFVYTLRDFVKNPHLPPTQAPSAAMERGRALFTDPIVRCSVCHNSRAPATQQFTDKQPNPDYDPSQTPRADLNNPFLVHDVGTTNVFDRTNPFDIASDQPGLLGFTLFQNENAQNPIPGTRNTLNQYLTPVMNDVWNTAPYLHDGSAATLLDVVRPCASQRGPCEEAGKGRNIDDLHGTTSFLSARQLNDLVAFEKAPYGPLTQAQAITGVALTIKRLRLRFGKPLAPARFQLVATASVGAQRLNPLTDGLSVTVGVPDGETMTLVEWDFAPGALQGRATKVRFSDHRGTRKNGLRTLRLAIKGGKLLLQVRAVSDFSNFRGRVPDYTIGVEVGDDVAAVTRTFQTKRNGATVVGP